MDKKLNFLFGLLGMLTIGIAILGYQTLPHSVLIGLAMLGAQLRTGISRCPVAPQASVWATGSS